MNTLRAVEVWGSNSVIKGGLTDEQWTSNHSVDQQRNHLVKPQTYLGRISLERLGDIGIFLIV